MHLVPLFTIHIVEADSDTGSRIDTHYAAFRLHLPIIDRENQLELGTCGHDGAGSGERAEI